MNPDTDHQMDALRNIVQLSQDVQAVRNWIDASEQIAETPLTEVEQ